MTKAKKRKKIAAAIRANTGCRFVAAFRAAKWLLKNRPDQRNAWFAAEVQKALLGFGLKAEVLVPRHSGCCGPDWVEFRGLSGPRATILASAFVTLMAED